MYQLPAVMPCRALKQQNRGGEASFSAPKYPSADTMSAQKPVLGAVPETLQPCPWCSPPCWEGARRAPCSRGVVVMKEHLPIFVFLYERVQLKHFLLKPIICIITLRRWSFTRTEVSKHWSFNIMHEPLIIEDVFSQEVLCSWTSRVVMRSKTLLQSNFYFYFFN